jgi:hypothetical protein
MEKSEAKDLMEVEDASPITLDQLKAVMPARQKQNVTPELVVHINKMCAEPEYRENFRNNVLGFVDVLNDPSTSMKGYLKAVKYVSFKIMGFSNQESWLRTFPERYARLVQEDKADAYVRSLVCAYNKGKMVNQILQQSLVPTWVLNQDKFQEAINKQAMIMNNPKASFKVQTDAANSLLTHLKRPEAAKVELEIDVKQDDSIGALRRTVIKLGEAQAKAILDGTINAKDVADSDILDGESVRVDE